MESVSPHVGAMQQYCSRQSQHCRQQHTAGYVGSDVVQKSEMLGTTMCDTFLESGRSQKLNGTMESPPKNLESWNPGILESWNLGIEQIDFIYFQHV